MLGNSLAGTALDERTAAVKLYELKLEIEGPENMVSGGIRSDEADMTYRCAIFVNVSGSRGGLVGCINEVFPSFPKVCRGFS